MSNQSATTTVVNELIETHNEREAGYKKAAELVNDIQAKAIFQRYASQSTSFASELIPYSDERSPQEVGKGPLSAIFRGWADLKAAVTGHDSKALYAWCETGEDAALRVFESAFKAGIPPAIQEIVQRQYAELKEAHGHIKALRDA
jgi:uncharacterized protein (TIGR02284 family)